MIAATNPDTGSLTVGYALGALTFAALLLAGLSYTAWRAHGGSVERWLDQLIAKKRARARAALDRGDDAIRRAVTEHENAYPQRRRDRRISVPKQLERTHRR